MSDTPVSAVAAAVDTARQATEAPAPAVEPKSVPGTPPVKNPQLDEYARKEKQLRAREREWQQKLQERDEQLKKYENEYIPKSRLTDPNSVLDTLADAGLTYEKITEILMNAPNSQDPTIRALRAEMKAIKDAQANQAKEQENATKTQYDAAIKSITTEVGLMVEGNAEYEMIASHGMQSAVVELIEQTFNSEGRLMDIAEAAKEVESYLVDEAIKMANSPKVQSRLKPQPVPDAETRISAPAKSPGVTTQLKTLTNNMETQPAKRSSEAERRARAIAAFAGKQG